MNNQQQVTNNAPLSTRIIQISDPHLFDVPEGRVRQVPVYPALQDVLDYIRKHHSVFDYMVITGDLTGDHKNETYEILRNELGEWASRSFVIPGNHDDRGCMREVFGDMIVQGVDAISFKQDAGGWLMLGLDTQFPGEGSGRIDPEHLAWLEEQLKEHADKPVLLFMHHPPIPVNSQWADNIGLQQGDEFRSLVRRSPNVRAIFTGHVHQDFNGSLGDVPVHTSPSTALQFAQDTEHMQRDQIPPGFRVIDLDGDEYQTRVVRLPELKYPPEK